MSEDVAPWNLLQIAVIALYPAWQSFTHMPTGMSLVALYVSLVVLCIPAVFIQLKLGNHQQKGVVALLSTHLPIAKGVGITLLIQLFLMCVYMVPLVTQYGLYAVIAVIQQPYVWGQCDNVWNTPSCQPHGTEKLNVDGAGLVDSSRMEAPEQQFFDLEFLQITNSINDVDGFPVWRFSELVRSAGISLMPVAMAITWTLIFLFIAVGGRICGWILFILGPVFLSLVFVTLGYGYSNLDNNGTSKFLQATYSQGLQQFTLSQTDSSQIQEWLRGFILVMHSVPVWTAILPTMGKMTGRGRLSRNLSWLVLLVVYAVTCQLPELAMAPYIGNLLHTDNSLLYSTMGIDTVFKTMAAAFTKLEIPATYALLFYLAIFVAGLMFLVVAMFTVLDNFVDALTDWVEGFRERRACVNACAALTLVTIGIGASVLHTTQAGMYYIVLMDQCVTKLYFITVGLYGVSLVVVYAKQNFGIAERFIMSMWCFVSTVITVAVFLYEFICTISIEPGYGGVKITDTWDLGCWVFASAPFLAIPAAAIHSFQTEEGPLKTKLKHFCCGRREERFETTREYGYLRPEPSAPPYGGGSEHHTYAYMDDDALQMDDVPYNKHYHPQAELEPLHRSSRI